MSPSSRSGRSPDRVPTPRPSHDHADHARHLVRVANPGAQAASQASGDQRPPPRSGGTPGVSPAKRSSCSASVSPATPTPSSRIPPVRSIPVQQPSGQVHDGVRRVGRRAQGASSGCGWRSRGAGPSASPSGRTVPPPIAAERRPDAASRCTDRGQRASRLDQVGLEGVLDRDRLRLAFGFHRAVVTGVGQLGQAPGRAPCQGSGSASRVETRCRSATVRTPIPLQLLQGHRPHPGDDTDRQRFDQRPPRAPGATTTSPRRVSRARWPAWR